MHNLYKSYKESKKVIVLPEGDDHCPMNKIYETAKELHPDPLLQYFDADFEEWVDLDADHVPQNKEKFKIVEKVGNVSFSIII